MRNEPLLTRFWRLIDTTPGQGPAGECWCWRGTRIGKAGYGQFTVHHRQRAYAHRVSYELEYAVDLPLARKAGILVCHACDNPPCVRPSHLFLGTDVDNCLDMRKKGRWRPGLQHGEHNPCSILSDADVRAIRADTRTLAKIAADYGVAASTVSEARSGKTWSHIGVMK